jgi:hypothetical protein
MIEIKTPTKEEIDLISYNEEIWERGTDDSCPPKEDFKLPYDMFEFLGCYLEDKIIGLASIEKDDRLHFEVLKPYRLYAREALKACLKQLNRNLYCVIPTYYRSVINFAKNNGFKEVGIFHKNCTKNGINYNRIKLIYENTR